MNDLKKAKELLKNSEYTCVICMNDEIHTSRERGVKPLVSMLKTGVCLSGFSAADKVVGRATAFLYALLKVKAVYANVMSKAALSVLSENGIYAEYASLTENIINRKGDGICPFEEAVLEISDKNEAFSKITERMKDFGIC